MMTLKSRLVLYKITLDFEAFVHESSILSLPLPTCSARTIAIRLHVYCAIYDTPPIPLVYVTHHTIFWPLHDIAITNIVWCMA